MILPCIHRNEGRTHRGFSCQLKKIFLEDAEKECGDCREREEA
jgi:hypothetical protein